MRTLLDRAISAFRNPALRGLWFVVLIVLPLAATAIIVGDTKSIERGAVYGTVIGVHSMDGKRGPTTRTFQVRLDSGEAVFVNVVERGPNHKGARVRLQQIDHVGGWPRTTYRFEQYDEHHSTGTR